MDHRSHRNPRDQHFYGKTGWRLSTLGALSWKDKTLMTADEMGTSATVETTLELSQEIDSIAIARMIDEVRGGDPIATAGSYNRTHNRHNR